MSMFYEKGTKVFYWDYDDTIKEAITDDVISYAGVTDYFLKGLDGKELGHITEKRIDVDKKTLLLKILLESTTGASKAKQCMAYYNERANDICWLLWGIDKNMNIKEELDNYEKEHGE